MTFIFGRKNLALTVFVPYDCNNSCRFCTSKKNYSSRPPSFDNVVFQLNRVLTDFSYPIQDVVFTGGEPMSNVEGLKALISVVPEKYNIYINTTFLNKNLDNFISFVNDCGKIKGINISRHCDTYENDLGIMSGIAEDKELSKIKKPVRINCVIQDQDLSKVLNRWKDMDVSLFLRKDYNKEMGSNELHNPYDATCQALLSEGFVFKHHTSCNVCDTTMFEKDGQMVAYHKGLKYSSIQTGNLFEINDLIIDQEGSFMYDWGVRDLRLISELEQQYKKIRFDTHSKVLTEILQSDQSFTTHHYCGCSCTC